MMKCLSIATAILSISTAIATTCSDITIRSDCGHSGTTQQDCEAAGCCWSPVDPNPDNQPWCFKKENAKTCPLSYSNANKTAAPFSDSEIQIMDKYFRASINVDNSGAVVAAPDYNTPGGSYFYHWARDGALSMGALLRLANSLDDVRDDMDNYVRWVAKVHNESDPNDLPSILPEPKYTIPDGTPYTGGWCRPQNDGPPLRSKTLVEYVRVTSYTHSLHPNLQTHTYIQVR